MSPKSWLAGVLAASWLAVGAIADEGDPFGPSEGPNEGPFSYVINNSPGDPFSDNGGPAEKAGKTKASPTCVWVGLNPERDELLHSILRSSLRGPIEFQDTTLEEVVAFLNDEYELNLLIDTVSLDEFGLGPDEPVSIQARNINVGRALQLVLEPLELTATVDDGLLLITTEEEALTKLKIAIYPVSDLVLESDYDTLIDTVTATIAADTWAENGGGEAEIRPYPQRGVLVVLQTSSVHQELSALFETLRRFPVEAQTTKSRPPQSEGHKGETGSRVHGEPVEHDGGEEGSGDGDPFKF